MQGRVLLLIATLITGTGCASTPSTVDDGDLPPCTAQVSGSDLTSWKEVRADGFTFCVPRDWRGNRREWKKGDSHVRWELGAAPPQPTTGSAPFTRGGPGMTSGGARPIVGMPVGMTETIGGSRAQLVRRPALTHFETGASWGSPEIYLEGVARDLDAANLQFVIYRTVRFTP